jgi:hypothetical protein
MTVACIVCSNLLSTGFVMPPEPFAASLAQGGYLPRGVPLLKRIVALPSHSVCRHELIISVDGIEIGAARERDRRGRALPVWQGCRVIADGEVFLMNWDEPASLDSRSSVRFRHPQSSVVPNRFGHSGRIRHVVVLLGACNSPVRSGVARSRSKCRLRCTRRQPDSGWPGCSSRLLPAEPTQLDGAFRDVPTSARLAEKPRSTDCAGAHPRAIMEQLDRLFVRRSTERRA